MTRIRILPILSIVLSLAFSACGSSASPLVTTTPGTQREPTSDPCAPENIALEVEKVHQIMREFDDESLLAQYTPRDQLNPSISNLQRIRRQAEDQPVPACLLTLKEHQMAHMNTVINTFLGLLGGADEETLLQGIALARQQHDEYTLELAGLLGLTVVAPTALSGEDNSLPPGPVVVFNPGPATVNLRAGPGEQTQTLGILDVGASTTAVGRNTDGTWIQIAVPGQPDLTVWVLTSLVQVSGQVEGLPVTAP